ncbi:hypothetical protein FH609_004130 [Streptomyces sp. 3MP-14]|uniref:Uncharacterized protein n=1 Tax=Streptomyces mimosae TaxID=2586635 RepID=A0A5N6A4J1_9ACTN|nr:MULTISPECIES: hypothetical protein [Streptomyces]KAB8162923.1 hypothetical protein FH607_019995 [Streptomyces mimosae]KAB8179136.1 hypothetical protein FH609_004130 [Streptomyces sp. 3MP-14]
MQPSLIRDALADAARAVTMPSGIRRLTCSGYVPDAVTEPHFFVGEFTADFDRAMNRSLDELEFTCRVLVGRQDDRAAQRVLDALLAGSGPASLKAAIEAARGGPGEYALGGLAHDLHVMRVQGYRWYEHQGTDYVGAELIIKVIGEG